MALCEKACVPPETHLFGSIRFTAASARRASTIFEHMYDARVQPDSPSAIVSACVQSPAPVAFCVVVSIQTLASTLLLFPGSQVDVDTESAGAARRSRGRSGQTHMTVRCHVCFCDLSPSLDAP